MLSPQGRIFENRDNAHRTPYLVTHLTLYTPSVQVMLLCVISCHVPPPVCEVTLLAAETVGVVFDQFVRNNIIDGLLFLPKTLINHHFHYLFCVPQSYVLCVTCYDFCVGTLRPWTVYVRT